MRDAALVGTPGLPEVLDKEAACRRFELPFDREGGVGDRVFRAAIVP